MSPAEPLFRAIVVGTDGSPTAAVAVAHAAGLARESGAELHLVTAYKVANPQFVAPEAAMAAATALETQAEQQRLAEQLVADAAGRLRQDGVKVQTHVWPGDAADAIIEVAEGEGADLIVVGNRGMTGARRFLLGSVPNKVSHHAPCSVMIVRTVTD